MSMKISISNKVAMSIVLLSLFGSVYAEDSSVCMHDLPQEVVDALYKKGSYSDHIGCVYPYSSTTYSYFWYAKNEDKSSGRYQSWDWSHTANGNYTYIDEGAWGYYYIQSPGSIPAAYSYVEFYRPPGGLTCDDIQRRSIDPIEYAATSSNPNAGHYIVVDGSWKVCGNPYIAVDTH